MKTLTTFIALIGLILGYASAQVPGAIPVDSNIGIFDIACEEVHSSKQNVGLFADSFPVCNQSTLVDLWPVERRGNQGCCSHHNGVCGCDSITRSIVCCDGSYSPSCGC